jgi:D-alanyl-D-alanine carboxypeptidase
VRAHSHRFGALLVAGACCLATLAGGAAQAAAPAAGSLDSATRAQLSKALDAAFAQVNAPGAIVGVRVGHSTWTATRGVTDTVSRTPVAVDEDTRVGSVTKTFTGTLILQLVDKGKLKLDETIERWFPQLPDARQITIRELGSMSSGIDTYTDNPTFQNEYFADPTRVWTPQELVAAGTSLPRQFAPGHGFFYSNTNFVMLGLIIEQVTGKPYAQVLRNNILQPLGLKHTIFPDNNIIPAPSWHGYTTQGTNNAQTVDSTSWSPSSAESAGQMISNLQDMLTWARAVGTGATLTAASQRARLQGNPASAMNGREYAFAIGHDHGWLAHDGEIPGFNAQLAYYPPRDITIIVLTNSDIANPPTAPGPTPAPVIFSALGAVMTPGNAP